MKIRQIQIWKDILLVVGIVTMLCTDLYKPLLLIGGVLVCFGLVIHFRYNKCPHCGKGLGRDVAAYCQHCGKKLN